MIILCLEINIFFYNLADLEKNWWLFHFLIPAYISAKKILESWKIVPSEGGDEAFICISRDHMINESSDTVGEIPSP